MINKKSAIVIALCACISTGLISGCTSTNKQESTGQYLDGTVITTKVKSRLLADKLVRGLPITVKTYKNTVQLSGFVNNSMQKIRAVEIASDVPGVQYVQDSLIIKSK